MKRIILLLDAINYKAEILDFAAAIAKPGKSKIVGVFLEHHHHDPIPKVKSIGGQIYVEEIIEDAAERAIIKATAQKNIQLFKDGCTQREVLALVHLDKGDLVQDIIEETRYADLMIVDPSTSLSGDNAIPSKLIQKILNTAECPVFIAPSHFDAPEEIIFAYDGTRSSLFALKQFYYLLPEFADINITILHVSENEQSKEKNITNTKLLKEWLEKKFSSVTFVDINGDARNTLFDYFFEKEAYFNKMLVTGAYGRNLLSSLLKPSAADLLLKAIDIPMFIAHC